jgi:hypothetical protein
MGLDMHLRQEIYVSTYNHSKSKQKIDKLGLPFVAECAYYQIFGQVAYWRNANQIHNWFVKNIQNGEDDCEKYFVPNSKLIELLELVNYVWNNFYVNGEINIELINEKLPPKSGFFFSSTDVDESYKQDLEYTKKILERITTSEHFKNSDFYYRSI